MVDEPVLPVPVLVEVVLVEVVPAELGLAETTLLTVAAGELPVASEVEPPVSCTLSAKAVKPVVPTPDEGGARL